MFRCVATRRDWGQCVWAACSDGGAACVSLALQPLVYVRGALGPAPPLAPAPPPPPAAHYMQPAAAEHLAAWSLGPYSAAVRVCATRTCAGGAVLTHAAPAVCCVLAAADGADGAADLSPDGSRDGSTDSLPDLLVLAGDEVYVWQSRATPQRQYLAV
uniref:SFRICE_019455 n=1 Tax=Spodoptera frugiperda TaxID=7108 RepID=A0A2H1W3A8_SPOFR